MVDQKIVDLYTDIRGDAGMVDRLMASADEAALTATIKAIGSEKGVDLDDTEIAAALSEADSVIQQAAGEDSLTDTELELVSGGAALLSAMFEPLATEVKNNSQPK